MNKKIIASLTITSLLLSSCTTKHENKIANLKAASYALLLRFQNSANYFRIESVVESDFMTLVQNKDHFIDNCIQNCCYYTKQFINNYCIAISKETILSNIDNCLSYCLKCFEYLINVKKKQGKNKNSILQIDKYFIF